MVRIKRKDMISRRLIICRRILKVDTQNIRLELISKLKDIFDSAHVLAKDENADLRVREKWARVAAYAAQTINSIARGFDEQMINKDLDELERLVNEAKARAQKSTSGAGAPVTQQR